MKKTLAGLIFLFFFNGIVTSQERTIGLQFNPFAIAKKRPHNLLKSQKGVILSLPFIDDFASTTGTPDMNLWEDQNVYVNSNFSWKPLSVGVATFDALDSAGYLYSQASHIPFRADFLTSLPIDLDYSPADSIFLSFFFQPQGLGDAPEPGDSLLVEYFAPLQNRWFTIYGIPGSTVKPFQQVMLAIKDTACLHSGFRFRFVNIASLASSAQDPGKIDNDDQWNIDYVRLDKNRSSLDTVLYDVAFTTYPDSVLKNYTSIPWSHYPDLVKKEIKPNMTLFYRNNYNQTLKVDRNFRIEGKGYSYNYLITSENISADTIQFFQPDFEQLPSDDNTSALFTISSWLSTDTVSLRKPYRWNDTVRYNQVFSNYYAYDDGSAEMGYGLSGEGTNGARFAMKFIAPFSDSLQAIKMYFNQSYKDANLKNFEIGVWNNNNGIPGDLIYSENSLSLNAQYSGLNNFITYKLSEPLMVPDTFYIGWIQTSETFLNLGLDLNHIRNDREYYNIDGSWTPSSIKGSVMLRPVMGKSINTGFHASVKKNLGQILAYPNPASTFISIDGITEFPDHVVFRMFNMQGVEVVHLTEIPGSLDISGLPAGTYMISIEAAGRVPSRCKLLILR